MPAPATNSRAPNSLNNEWMNEIVAPSGPGDRERRRVGAARGEREIRGDVVVQIGEKLLVEHIGIARRLAGSPSRGNTRPKTIFLIRTIASIASTAVADDTIGMQPFEQTQRDEQQHTHRHRRLCVDRRVAVCARDWLAPVGAMRGQVVA